MPTRTLVVFVLGSMAAGLLSAQIVAWAVGYGLVPVALLTALVLVLVAFAVYERGGER